MEDFFDGTLSNSDWFLPVIIALIILPVLVIFFNEFLFRAKKNEKRLVPPVKLLRNFILPLIAIFIIVNQLMGVTRETMPVKLIETLIYILILNALLAILNVFFFSGGEQSLVKTKIPQLFLDIFRVLMVLLGTAIILSVVWGADLGGMITALGVGSFVLGLALQDTLGNLFAGIALIYEKPFKEGDNIQIDDWYGEVIEMNWRAVRLISEENVMVVIPHLIIGSGTVQNYSAPTRTHIVAKTLDFSYDIPPNKVKKILVETLLAIPSILKDPAPSVETDNYADNSIQYCVNFAVATFEDRTTVLDEFMTKVWYMAQRHHLEMPYPHLNILKPKDEAAVRSTEDILIEQELEKLLQLIPIREDQISNLKKGTRLFLYGTGEYIIEVGKPAGKLYILKSGQVKMTFIGVTKIQERILYKGEYFGQISIKSDQPVSFSVQVTEDAEVLILDQPQVIEMIENNPKLAFYLGNGSHLNNPAGSKNGYAFLTN